MSAAPTIYLFHGEDDVAIAAAIHTLQSKLGEASNAEMNTTRLEAAPSLDELRTAAFAVPFLAKRRLVILHAVGKAFPRAEGRAPFIDLLDAVPPSTALVLLEENTLPAKHWLLKWAAAAGERAFVRAFKLPEGGGMVNWIKKKVVDLGGEIEPQAASSLAAMIGSDTCAAGHEIEKLLAYAAYQRPITAAAVAELALEIGEQGDFFGLIDALSAGSGAAAMRALHKLMAERDLISLYFGLVGHFRVLLQVREIVDAGGGESDVAKHFNMHPYRAKKLSAQSRHFDVDTLEAIYHRLLDLDHQIKTGIITPELAMDSLVASLSAEPA